MRTPAHRYDRGSLSGLPGPIWPPERIAGCVAHYNMLDGVYTDGGGTVTAFRNMITGSDDMAEATNPPTLDLTGINGRPCFTGDGTSMQLISTEATVVAPFIGNMRARTALFVIGGQPDSTIRAIFAAANSGVSAARSVVYRHLTNGGVPTVSETITPDAAVTSNASFRTPQTSPRVVAIINQGPSVIILMNGARAEQQSPSLLVSPGQVTPNRVGFLCRPDSAPDQFHSISIGAGIIYDHALTVPECVGLSFALMGRWGIQP